MKIFDTESHTEYHTSQEKRVDGYLAERLLGIYVTYQRMLKTMQIIELPRVHFASSKKEYYIKKVCNAIVPPGTKWRSILKKVFRGRG